MSAPLVSIVIVNRNYGAYLAEAIESALAQVDVSKEVVVVDDGSTDDSIEVARRFSVRLLAQHNQGVGAARNAGAAMTRGSFIMFLDADDVLDPGYAMRCYEALESAPSKTAYAYTKMRLFGTQAGIFESRPFDRKALLNGNFVHASALIRRSVFDMAGGFDRSWRLGYEDYELWVRILSMGYGGVFVPQPLLNYRRHPRSRNSLSESQLKQLRWRMCGTYPHLYMGVLWRHPLKMVLWMMKIRCIRDRRK